MTNDPNTVQIPSFTIHVKRWKFNPKIDFRHKEAAVNIELSHIQVRTLIQELEKQLIESRGAIRIEVSGTRADY